MGEAAPFTGKKTDLTVTVWAALSRFSTSRSFML
jgi:hypothetical protein